MDTYRKLLVEKARRARERQAYETAVFVVWAMCAGLALGLVLDAIMR